MLHCDNDTLLCSAQVAQSGYQVGAQFCYLVDPELFFFQEHLYFCIIFLLKNIFLSETIEKDLRGITESARIASAELRKERIMLMKV